MKKFILFRSDDSNSNTLITSSTDKNKIKKLKDRLEVEHPDSKFYIGEEDNENK